MPPRIILQSLLRSDNTLWPRCLDAVRLRDGILEQMDTIQLKGLRKILHMETPFGQLKEGKERSNTTVDGNNFASKKQKRPKSENG